MLPIREPSAEGKRQPCLRETPFEGQPGPWSKPAGSSLTRRVGRMLLQPQPWKGRVWAAGLPPGWGVSNAETPVGSSPAFPVGGGSCGGKDRSGALNHLALPRAGGRGWTQPGLLSPGRMGWAAPKEPAPTPS